MATKYKKQYKYSKRLPDVIKTTKPSSYLREKLYQEETFDCLKNLIRSAPQIINEPVVQVPKNNKGWRKHRLAEAREKILGMYTTEELISFNSKKKRRTQSKQMEQYEFNVFTEICKQLGKGKRRLNKHPTRFKRRSKDKKKRKHSQYETYINSKAWEQRKNTFWQNHPRLCAVCGTSRFIHLHHMHYGKFGNEPDEHLVPLCKKHHEQYHAENGVKRDMINSTMEFIERNQPSLTSNSFQNT